MGPLLAAEHQLNGTLLGLLISNLKIYYFVEKYRSEIFKLYEFFPNIWLIISTVAIQLHKRCHDLKNVCVPEFFLFYC